MPRFLKYSLGVTFILAAAIGLAFSLFAIRGVWQARSTANQVIDNTIQVLDDTLGTTQTGIELADQALQTASDSVISAETATLSMAQAVNDIGGLVDIFILLTSLGIPGLETSQAGSLQGASQDLSNTELAMLNLSATISQASLNIIAADDLLGDYQANLDQARGQLAYFQENLQTWTLSLSWFLTIGLAWLAITQLGLLYQGIAIIQKP